jgi:hypothetical protein
MSTKAPGVFGAPKPTATTPAASSSGAPPMSTKAPGVFGASTATNSTPNQVSSTNADAIRKQTSSDKPQSSSNTISVPSVKDVSVVIPKGKPTVQVASDEYDSFTSAATPEEFKKIINHFGDRVRARNSRSRYEDDDMDEMDKSIDQLILCCKKTRMNVGELLNAHQDVSIHSFAISFVS